jgi:nitrite reductase (NADH) large subunit
MTRKLLVIGHGMVAHRLCETLVEAGARPAWDVTVVGEEPRPAYDRVQLTHYFETRDPQSLAIGTREYYAEHGIELCTSARAVKLDRAAKQVTLADGRVLGYDALVLATGSSAFVPKMPGTELPGVFVYRTIEDLEAIIAWSDKKRRAAVIGGGLLGLEAARAVQLLGLETHVIEAADRLMPRQLDVAGGTVLANKIRALGVEVHVGQAPSSIEGSSIEGSDRVHGLRFADGRVLEVDMVVISAGIRPRTELAEQAGLTLAPRGGVVVDDALTTDDPAIHAIGEVASHRGVVYGLVAPGYAMAETLARRLTGDTEARFESADMSTKLKLMGVDVASFGDALGSEAQARGETAVPVVLQDFVRGTYKKLLVDPTGKRVLGGMLVGDVAPYGELLQLTRSRARPRAC